MFMGRRLCLAIPLFLLLFPSTSHAIQLHWSSGADTLSSATAVRCTLLVEATEHQETLPVGWTLVWTGDSCSVSPVVTAPPVCSEDIAQVSALDLPATAADSAANLSYAHFCSADSIIGAPAKIVLDLEGYSRAKFKIVALDPADPESSSVLESNDVTYNGGVVDAYPAVVLRASTSRCNYG
jgi:hypothetical protein